MTERTYRSDGSVATSHIGADTSDDDIASAADKARLGTTAGSGLGSKGKALGGDAPKQRDGESAADFGRRLREYREGQSKTPQKAAYRSLLSK